MTRTMSSINNETTSKSSSNKKKSTTTTTTTQNELKKLKSLLPTLKRKPASSPIEIVMETIRYIRELEDQLIDRFHMDTFDSNSISVPLTPSRPSSLSDMSSSTSLSTDASSPSTLLRDIGNSD